LGVAHGFSTAVAGDAKLATVRSRLLHEAKIQAPLTTVHQVHGCMALWAPLWSPDAEADAVLTKPGHAIGVYTADCVPILLVDRDARVAAAVHAGWRGTLAGVLVAAVEALVEEGARAEWLRAAIGPRVGACCYVVGDDLAGRFRTRFGPTVVVPSAGQGPKLDLGLANRAALIDLGLRADHIELLPGCTVCAKDASGAPSFHSYRREKDLAGRQLSFIAL
jgi:YfiH family protein